MRIDAEDIEISHDREKSELHGKFPVRMEWQCLEMFEDESERMRLAVRYSKMRLGTSQRHQAETVSQRTPRLAVRDIEAVNESHNVRGLSITISRTVGVRSGGEPPTAFRRESAHRLTVLADNL